MRHIHFTITFAILLIATICQGQNGVSYYNINPSKTLSYEDSIGRYGHLISTEILLSQFAYEEIDSNAVWTLHLSAALAKSISLQLTEVNLATNGVLLFADGNQTIVHGNLLATIPSSLREFATPMVEADTAFLQYSQPISSDHNPHLNVKNAIYGFRKPSEVYNEEKTGFGSASNCIPDAICEQASWCDQINSVGIIHSGGQAFCSGALITTSSQDKQPYFLTAKHCVDGQNTAFWVIYFNYQSESCDPSVDGRFLYYIAGAQLRAEHQRADYALLEFYAPVPYSYNPYFAGWTSTANKPNSGAIIHHARGDVKKISTYSEKPKKYNWNHDYISPSDNGSGTPKIRVWQVSNFDEGGIQGVSSGGPLFNENGQIVGNVSGIGADANDPVCTREDNYFGRFRKMMFYGARSYLDNIPLTSYVAISGISYEPCPNNRSLSGYITNGYHKADEYIYTTGTALALAGSETFIEAGSRVHLNPGFHAKYNAKTHIHIKPCASACVNLKNREQETILAKDTSRIESIGDNLIKNDGIKVFPNPSNSVMTVQWKANQFQHLVLVNAMGQIVFSKNIESNDQNIKLDVTQFPPGIYIVKCSGIHSSEFQSLVILR
ncbi:MAG: hypothetical protein ACI9J3_002888 [Parvicellaceae bacterium]|jgi:hypothetical protein